MQAGKLDTAISVQSYVTDLPDDYGTPGAGWTLFASVRAQTIQASTDEYLRGYGEGAETAIIFRTRFVAGIELTHRIEHRGRYFNIREVKELGRRKGLELRCEEVRT